MGPQYETTGAGREPNCAELDEPTRTIGIEVVTPELRALAHTDEVRSTAQFVIVERAAGHEPEPWTWFGLGPKGGPMELLGEMALRCHRDRATATVLPPPLDVIEALWGGPVTGAPQAFGEGYAHLSATELRTVRIPAVWA